MLNCFVLETRPISTTLMHLIYWWHYIFYSLVCLFSFVFWLFFLFCLIAMLSQKDKEIDELKSKIAEVMAVMPVTSSPNCYSPNPPAISLASGIVSSLLYTPKYNMGEEKVAKSNLDPNASVYTPKVARLTSESEIWGTKKKKKKLYTTREEGIYWCRSKFNSIPSL